MPKMKNPATRIFVYGTLRKGGGNDYMLDRQKFVADVVTEPQYKMYTHSYPFLLPTAVGRGTLSLASCGM